MSCYLLFALMLAVCSVRSSRYKPFRSVKAAKGVLLVENYNQKRSIDSHAYYFM